MVPSGQASMKFSLVTTNELRFLRCITLFTTTIDGSVGLLHSIQCLPVRQNIVIRLLRKPDCYEDLLK